MAVIYQGRTLENEFFAPERLIRGRRIEGDRGSAR
jgi:hypothetical protein